MMTLLTIDLDKNIEIIFILYVLTCIVLTIIVLYIGSIINIYISKRKNNNAAIQLFEKRLHSMKRIEDTLKWESTLREVEEILVSKGV